MNLKISSDIFGEQLCLEQESELKIGNAKDQVVAKKKKKQCQKKKKNLRLNN